MRTPPIQAPLLLLPSLALVIFGATAVEAADKPPCTSYCGQPTPYCCTGCTSDGCGACRATFLCSSYCECSAPTPTPPPAPTPSPSPAPQGFTGYVVDVNHDVAESAGTTAATALLRGVMAVPAAPPVPTADLAFWLGAEDLSCSHSLMQPVLRFCGRCAVPKWQMNLWWIAPWLLPHGSTVTNMADVDAGDTIGMGLQQLSANATFYTYRQWWVFGGGSGDVPTVGIEANALTRTATAATVQSCTFAERASTQPTGIGPGSELVLAGGWRPGATRAQCQALCCAQQPACKGFALADGSGAGGGEEAGCYLLGSAFSSSGGGGGGGGGGMTPSVPGWTTFLRGQALDFAVPRSRSGCSRPASWAFGAVLELLTPVDSFAQLPAALAAPGGVRMEGIVLETAAGTGAGDAVLVNPPTAAGAVKAWVRSGWSPARLAAKADALGNITIETPTGDVVVFRATGGGEYAGGVTSAGEVLLLPSPSPPPSPPPPSSAMVAYAVGGAAAVAAAAVLAMAAVVARRRRQRMREYAAGAGTPSAAAAASETGSETETETSTSGAGSVNAL